MIAPTGRHQCCLAGVPAPAHCAFVRPRWGRKDFVGIVSRGCGLAPLPLAIVFCPLGATTILRPLGATTMFRPFGAKRMMRPPSAVVVASLQDAIDFSGLHFLPSDAFLTECKTLQDAIDFSGLRFLPSDAILRIAMAVTVDTSEQRERVCGNGAVAPTAVQRATLPTGCNRFFGLRFLPSGAFLTECDWRLRCLV